MYPDKEYNIPIKTDCFGNADGLNSEYGLLPPEFGLTANVPETKQDVLTRHKKNTQLVQQALTEMSNSPDIVEQNTAEWILSQTSKFFVATATHDSVERLSRVNIGSDYITYFGAKHDANVFPNTDANYSDDVLNWDDITISSPGTLASTANNTISFYDPIKKGSDKQSIKNTLVHEVQHVADKHEDDEIHDTPDNVDDAWNSYKTEFRAYWVSGEYEKFSPDKEFGSTGFNERQWEIYMHLVMNYGYVKKFKPQVVTKSKNATDNGKTLIQLITAYSKPDGFNLDNSVRIENFYRAIEKCDKKMGITDPEIIELEKAANEMTEQEKENFYDDDNKDEIQQLLKQNLNDEMFRRINYIIIGHPV